MLGFTWIRRKIAEFRAKKQVAEAGTRQLCQMIGELREKESLGDEDATITLKNVKAVVQEQVRPLSDDTPRSMVLPVVLFLALAVVGGCTTANTVTDEDRVIVHYNAEAWQLVESALPMVAGDPAAAVGAIQVIVAKYGKPLSATMKKNWGPPANPPSPISEESVNRAIQSSGKSHEVPWWQAALGGALSIGTILLGLGSRFARFMPGGSTIYNVAQATMEGVERYMAERKAAGDHDSASRLAAHLEHLHDDPRIKPVVDGILSKVKKKVGIAPETEAESEPTPTA